MGSAGLATSRSRRDFVIVAALTTLTSTLYYAALEFFWRVVSPFDSSHLINTAATSPGLRWDALHFLGIAKRGYQYEQQLAFQPCWQAILHMLDFGPSHGGTDDAILRGSVVVNALIRVLANVYLYKLTAKLFQRRTAFIASILYAFPPAPAVLSAPYTESSYALMTFCGLHFMASGSYRTAAVSFAIATSIRATGVFTVVPLAYAILIPALEDKQQLGITHLARRLILTGTLSIIVISPFLAFQGWTWNIFCAPESTRPWCDKLLPSSYSFVQGAYWNIGLFRYWRPEQLPNFVLAAPVLSISLLGLRRQLTTGLPTSHANSRHLVAAILVYQTLMNWLLIFASHTQIALRLAPTDPVLWWTLATSLATKTSRELAWFEKMWCWWVCIWGAASMVLWAGHYPPA